MKHRWSMYRDYCMACERSAAELVNEDKMECTPLTAVERDDISRLTRAHLHQSQQKDAAQ